MSCGQALAISWPGTATAAAIDAKSTGVWRYARWYGIAPPPYSLGEHTTPLVEANLDGGSTCLKLDYLLPTGSFKDRGAATMIHALKILGIQSIVLDSSGNAAASVSAYAAAAGIKCEVFAATAMAPAKLHQIMAYGASVHSVRGPRAAISDMAQKFAAETGGYYAQHGYNPYFLCGLTSEAFEIWEQLGRKEPEDVFVPVGNGTLLLGLAYGFDLLRNGGLIRALPRLWAVQSSGCAPVDAAMRGAPFGGSCGNSVADGIQIPKPPRLDEIIACIRRSGGGVIKVAEKAILEWHRRLALAGFYVEHTAAVAMAGFARSDMSAAGRRSIVVLTGTGLKRGPSPSSMRPRRARAH